MDNIDKEIIEAVEFIKKNSPKLHLYVAAKLLEKAERGTLKIKAIDARKTLGSIFHVSRECQLKILNELEKYKLLLKINRKEYIIPIRMEECKEFFSEKELDPIDS